MEETSDVMNISTVLWNTTDDSWSTASVSESESSSISYRPSSSTAEVVFEGNPYGETDVVHAIVLVWAAISLVSGSIGNVLVIAAVWLHRSLRKIGNVFIVNLAVTDICVSLLINGFSIVGILTESQFFVGKDWLCEIIGIVCITCCVCSMWTIAAIGVNRYVSICHWPHYHTVYNKKTTILMVAGIWFFSFLIDLPNIVGWNDHKFDWKTMMCTGDMAVDKSYTIFFSVFAFVIPLLVIVYSYVRIYVQAYQSTTQLQRASQDDSRPVNRSSDLRLARSVLLIIIVFVAMWTPYALIIIINFGTDVGRNTFIFTILLAHTNSSVNCFLYAATNRNFRQGYVFFFNLIFCRREKAPKMVEKRVISVSQGTLRAEDRL